MKLSDEERLVIEQFRRSRAENGGPAREIVFVAIPIAAEFVSELGGHEAIRERVARAATKALFEAVTS